MHTLYAARSGHDAQVGNDGNLQGAQRSALINQNRQQQASGFVNDVDTWIDELDDNRSCGSLDLQIGGIGANVLMASLVQQQLPKLEVPRFAGEALKWVEFIVAFRDVVHNLPYLNDKQRHHHLNSHLDGEAKDSVREYTNDPRGYVASLKKLKYMFGQRSTVARAVLTKVTRGKAVGNHDPKGLSRLYYDVCRCLITLQQLNYASDLFSSDTLAQVVKRLPPYLVMKWAERSLAIRNRDREEPSLVHLGAWLKDRVLVVRQVGNQDEPKKKSPEDPSHINSLSNKPPAAKTCDACGKEHPLWKCKDYKAAEPEKRWEIAKTAELCMNCFSKGHKRDKCPSNNKCLIAECGKKHHSSLHKFFTQRDEALKAERERRRREAEQRDEQPERVNNDVNNQEDAGAVIHVLAAPPTALEEAEGGRADNTNIGSTRSSAQVFLQIVPVSITIGEKTVETYALIDDGSQSTLLREEFFKRFNVRGEPAKMNQGTISETKYVPGTKVKVTVAGRNGSNPIEITNAFVQPGSRFNMPSRPEFKDFKDGDVYTHLDGLSFEAVAPEEICILIGADSPESHISSKVARGRIGQPLAFKTPFGWALFGPASGSSSKVQHTATMASGAAEASIAAFWEETDKAPTVFVNMVRARTEVDLNEAIVAFWRQEHCGILPQKEVAMSREDIAALKRMEEETTMVNGHYQVPMLWRDSNERLPNNMAMVRKRFEFLAKKLRADPKLFEQYKAVIDGYLQADPPYARKMKPEEVQQRTPKTWTLPTFPVFHPNKPEKPPRVVNDAAAAFHGISLNSALVTGPDLLNLLVGVLIRFRNGEIAIAGDIEAMFHQVRASLADSDSLRFLWKDDVTSEEPPDTYQMLVHIFGAKDSPTVANYAVKRTARDNQEKFSALAYESALRAFYVDDLLKALHDKDAAINLAKELMEMMKCGGFRLCKFLSNCREVLEALPASELSPAATLHIEDEGKLDRALGILWDTIADCFTFSFQVLDLPMTKRGIVTTTAKLFDPLGFLTPFLLIAKLIIQVLWRLGCDWDEIANEDIQKQWQRWIEGAKKVGKIKIPRQYVMIGDRRVVMVQLHVFCDASEDAFGACAYVRMSFKCGQHESSLVMSKSRLAPIKTVTIPRLELNAARCGARLARLVVHEMDLPIERIQYWSDSTLTLQYINNTKHRMNVFVGNRVSEIYEVSEPKQWAKVPGEINPADLLTRGVIDPERLLTKRWYCGPEFLDKDEEEWPELDVDHLDEGDIEIKRRPLFVGVTLVEVEEVDFEKISSWRRLLRVTAWVVRFIHNFLNKNHRRLDETLSLDELNEAEQLVYRDIQHSAFQAEIRSLQDGKALPASNSLSKTSPFVDADELLRVGGRLRRISVPVDMKHPIILPRQHRATRLLLEAIHRRSGHVGPAHTLAISRERYWIIGGKVLVNQIITQCFFCRVRRAKLQFPYMADLPVCRAAIDEPPFHHCGVDLFGPVTTKLFRKTTKRWVVLYTCLTIRCVHLEIVEAADTDAFINSVRRFVNRRGAPKFMYSDNGTNFKGATSELKEFVEKLDKVKITDFATSNHILWTFNPPAAPHMGGAWERLVRSSKEVLFGLMKDHTLTDPQLLTFVTEAEAILNSRPLTHLSDDASDLDALTPNHVLLGQHRNWTSITDVSEADINSRRQWKQVQALRSIFWTRWVREYLPLLASRPCWRDKTPNFRANELVLVKDEDLKRNKWPLARITETYPGDDGVVRKVRVRMRNGEYDRPVAKLLKLEDTGEREEIDSGVTPLQA